MHVLSVRVQLVARVRARDITTRRTAGGVASRSSLSFTAWCVGERRAAVSSVFRAVPSLIIDQRTSIAEAGLERFFLFFPRPPVSPLNRGIREHLMADRWRKGGHG